jgi:tetratricopeptide (TPR) repeat protein
LYSSEDGKITMLIPFSQDTLSSAMLLLEQASQNMASDNIEPAQKDINQALEMLQGMMPPEEIPEKGILWQHIKQAPLFIQYQFALCRAFQGMATIYRILGNYQLSQEFAQKGMQIAKAWSFNDMINDLIFSIGTLYTRMGMYTQALQHYNQCLEASEVKFTKPANLANLYNNLGIIHWRLEQYEQALDFFGKAQKKYELAGNAQGIVQTLINLASVNLTLQEAEKGIYFLNQAIERTNPDNKMIMAYIQVNLGNAHYFVNEFDKAMECYEIALRLHRELDIRQNIPIILRNIGSIYLKEEYKDYSIDKGGEYLAESIALLEQSSDPYLLEQTLDYYANSVLAKQSKWKEAFIHLKRSIMMRKDDLNKEAHTKLELTTIKLLEREKKILEEKNEELRILHEEKNEYIAIASHNLQNPLSAITKMAQALAKQKLSAGERRILHKNVLELSSQMYALIKKLLDDNALDEYAIPLNIDTINLIPIIQTILKKVDTETVNKGISISFEQHSAHMMAQCDEKLAEQILENLLQNAIIYSSQGSRISLQCHQHNAMIRTRVEYALNASHNSTQQMNTLSVAGTAAMPEQYHGMALILARKMAKIMKGSVFSENNSFILELPAGS